MISNKTKFILVFLSIFLKYSQFLFNHSKIIIYLYFAILLFFSILNISNIKIRKKTLLNIVLVSLNLLFLTLLTSSLDFAIPILFYLLFYNENKEKLLKYILYSSIFCFILTLLLSFTGLIDSSISYRLVDGVLYTRNSLGFQTVNAPFLHLFPIIILSFCLCKNYKFLNIIYIIILLILYRFTNCRTGLICIIICLLLFNFIKNVNLNKYEKISKYSFFIFTILSVTLACFFGENLEINSLVSSRFSFWNHYLNNSSNYSLFGINLIENMAIDNLFLNFLFRYGIIGYLLIALYFSKIKFNNTKEFLAFFVTLIYCIFESINYYYLNISFILICFNYLDYKNKNYEKQRT